MLLSCTGSSAGTDEEESQTGAISQNQEWAKLIQDELNCLNMCIYIYIIRIANQAFLVARVIEALNPTGILLMFLILPSIRCCLPSMLGRVEFAFLKEFLEIAATRTRCDAKTMGTNRGLA